MELIGKTTINPLLFYSGKISGYIIWVLLLVSLFPTQNIGQINPQRWAVIILLCFGLILTIAGLINPGKSTRPGIPEENTELKKNGFYKISRNPIYLGFNLFSLAAVLSVGNFVVLIVALYSIIVYHLIILAEEKFLEYKKNVRRYI